jgi:hypothetical protein
LTRKTIALNLDLSVSEIPFLIAWVKALRPTPFEQTTPNPVITTPPHLTIFKIIKIVSRLVNIFFALRLFLKFKITFNQKRIEEITK